MYDADQHMIVVVSINISYASTAQPLYDSGRFIFTIDPVSSLPNGYTTIYRKEFYTDYESYRHIIYYDNQNRVSKDSVVEIKKSTNNSIAVSNYTYTDNIVTVATINYGGSGTTSLDSFFVNNGNLVGRNQYYFNNGTVDFSSFETYYPNTTYANPLYDPKISASVGIFGFYIGAADLYSKNFLNYTDEKISWSTDSKGRLVTGTGDKGTTIKINYHQ
jgi:hypothetical protein